MKNAVNAVPDAEFIFRRLKVNVGGAILERLPDDLVDELDDAGVLIIPGDFAIGGNLQFQRLVLGHFVEGLRADAVVFLQRLLDFRPRRQREADRTAGIEGHCRLHRGIEGIVRGHLQALSILGDGDQGKLERDLRGNAFPGDRIGSEAGQLDIRPADGDRELLEELILRHTGLPGEERQLPLATRLRAGFVDLPPGGVPIGELRPGGESGAFENGLEWRMAHEYRVATSS